MYRGAKARQCCIQPAARQYHDQTIKGRRRRGTGCRCCCWSAGAGLHLAGLSRAHAARRLHASSSSGRWRRQDPMTTPRRATRSPGLFVRFDPLPLRKTVIVCQGVTPCGMLDNMILYNRPRRRGRGRGLRLRVRRAIIRTFDPWAAVRREAVRSLLYYSRDFGQDGGTRRAQAETSRQEDDATRGGFTARRSARGLGEDAHAAHLRRRWARMPTRGAHIMRRSDEARDALREIMPQIMTWRAQRSRETYILLRLQADRLRVCSPQCGGKGVSLSAFACAREGSGF